MSELNQVVRKALAEFHIEDGSTHAFESCVNAIVRALDAQPASPAKEVVAYASVNQWLLSLPEGELKHVQQLGKWELADKVFSLCRCDTSSKALSPDSVEQFNGLLENAARIDGAMPATSKAEASSDAAQDTANDKAINALLWCYHRLKNGYGRLPFVEEAIAELRAAPSAAPAQQEPVALVPAAAFDRLSALNESNAARILELEEQISTQPAAQREQELLQELQQVKGQYADLLTVAQSLREALQGQPAAQRNAIIEALEAIVNGDAKKVPKNAKCKHDKYSWEDCEQCISDFAQAVIDRALAGKTAPAAGGQDTARIEYMEAWLRVSKSRGFARDSYNFTTDKPLREQLDDAMSGKPEATAPAQDGTPMSDGEILLHFAKHGVGVINGQNQETGEWNVLPAKLGSPLGKDLVAATRAIERRILAANNGEANNG